MSHSMISINGTLRGAKVTMRVPLGSHFFEECLAFAKREENGFKINQIGLSLSHALTQGDVK